MLLQAYNKIQWIILVAVEMNCCSLTSLT